MTADHDAAVAIIVVMIPAAMPAPVMPVELGTRATVVTVAVIVPVAADAHAEFGRAGNGRHRNGYRSHGGEYKFPHGSSPVVVAHPMRTNAAADGFGNDAGTL